MPAKDKEKLRATQRRYKEKNREAINERKRARYQLKPEKDRARRLEYQQNNRARLYAYNAKWQRGRCAAVRSEMIRAFGGCCECCGEAEPKFLELDHTNNDGKAKRAIHGNGQQEMLALKERGWPREGYQLLCCNCHQGRHRNGGICPHKSRPA